MRNITCKNTLLIFFNLTILLGLYSCAKSDKALRKESIEYIKCYNNANWVNNIDAIYSLEDIQEYDDVTHVELYTNLTISLLNQSVDDSENEDLYAPLIMANYVKSMITNKTKAKQIYDCERGIIKKKIDKLENSNLNQLKIDGCQLVAQNWELLAWQKIKATVVQKSHWDKARDNEKIQKLLQKKMIDNKDELTEYFCDLSILYATVAREDYNNAELYFDRIAKYYRLAYTINQKKATKIFKKQDNDVKEILQMFDICI